MGRAGWGAIFAFLIVATASCSSAPPVKPAPAHDISDARPIAREIGDILLNFAAYNYAVVGGVNGERIRVVGPDRYAAVARAQASLIGDAATKIVASVVDTAGPVHDKLVVLADELGTLRKDALSYSDARGADALARIIGDVDRCYVLLHDLESLLKDDSTLDKTIERGMSIKTASAPGKRALVTVGPFAGAAEAADVAREFGAAGSAATESPFVVRITFPDRASADAKAKDLQAHGMPAIVIDETAYAFTRSGAAPDAELWREPDRFIDTHGGARKVALSPNAALVATGSDDGYVAIFTNDGVLRSLPRLNAGVNQLVFSDDARFLIGGGQVLVTWALPRPTDSIGTPMRLQNAAQSVVYIPKANAFAASSRGDGSSGGIVGGRSPDGVVLGDPFPIQLSSGGGVLAASDAGELFLATPVGGEVDVRVLNVGAERFPRGVLRVPGALVAFAVDRSGSRGAAVTDKGTYRFSIKAADPSKTIVRQDAPVRDVEYGADGTLYLLDAKQLTAVSADGAVKWKQPLVDGRRIAVGIRPVVLDGTDKLVVFAPQDGTPDLLAPLGQIQDLVVSSDGRWVGVVADARRAVLFKLQ